MKSGFDSEKYLHEQSQAILERAGKFDDKLYLEFGGKLLCDFHAARVLPGFDPDTKIKLLQRMTFTADFYQRVWTDCILAFDLYGEFNSSGTPWPMLARMGGNQRMRGYYKGQYTDNDLITAQIELRQRVWRRIGCVAWAGAGNVFPTFREFDWAETLPNYGFGLRWELKKRVNIRLDYGFGKKTDSFLLSINEAF